MPEDSNEWLSEYFTSLKLKLNNSGLSLFPKVQKCQILDSMCFMEGVGCISSHLGAFKGVSSAKGKYISAKQKFILSNLVVFMPN